MQNQLSPDFQSFFDLLKQEYRQLEKMMNNRFDSLEGRLDGIEGRLDGIEGRLDGVEEHLNIETT